jgi:N-acetylmuramoyl-L-alanine amidase
MIKISNNFRMLRRLLVVVFIVVSVFFFYNKRSDFYFSPNFDGRPKGQVVDTIILHATQIDTIEKVIKYFSMEKSRLSAHYTIGKDGRTVQHVKDNDRAWHAGESKTPDGRQKVNDFSIGIELVNLNDGLDPYTEEQILALKELIKVLKTKWPIKYVYSHAQVAMPPGRKTDPQGLDFTRLDLGSMGLLNNADIELAR